MRRNLEVVGKQGYFGLVKQLSPAQTQALLALLELLLPPSHNSLGVAQNRL
jgi:hypothetical protein